MYGSPAEKEYEIRKSELEDLLKELLLETDMLIEEMFTDLLAYENLLLTLEFKHGVTNTWKGRTTLSDYGDDEIKEARKYLQGLFDF